MAVDAVPRHNAKMSDAVRDRAVPNLPSSDLDATEAFYSRIGFARSFRDDGWMILRRGDVQLEFFPAPGLDPATSASRCALRVGDVDELAACIVAAGVPIADTGFPRLHEVRPQEWGLRAGHLVDPDGNLLTLIEERSAAGSVDPDWIEHRRGVDGELLGWMEPAGEGFVVIDLLGRPRTSALDWLAAEEALEALGIGYLGDPYELELESGERLRVRITEASPRGIRVKREDWGAIGVGAPRRFFALEFPAPARLQPLVSGQG